MNVSKKLNLFAFLTVFVVLFGVGVYADTASCDLGPTNVDNNLSMTSPAPADGDTVGATDLGLNHRDLSAPTVDDHYMYFKVADTFALNGNHPTVTVSFDYYDTAGSVVLKLQYDQTTSAYQTHTTVITTGGTLTWKTATFSITDAYFGNRENNSSDMRIVVNGTNQVHIDKISVATPGTVVSCDLDATNVNVNMNETSPALSDGHTTAGTLAGRTERSLTTPATDHFIYFQIADSIALNGNNPTADIAFDYYDDTGSVQINVQYDATSSAYLDSTSVVTAGSLTWKTATISVTNAYFGNRQNGSSDLRVHAFSSKQMYIDKVSVTFGAGSPPPPTPSPTPPPSTTLKLGPNLGKVTTSAVTITFETSASYTGKVYYGSTLGTYPSSVSDTSARTWHELTISGLTAGASYYYYVTNTPGGPTVGQGDGNYKFQINPSSGTVFNFIAYGDTRTNPTKHLAVINSMLSNAQNDRFIIHAGDLVEFGATLSTWYPEFFDVTRSIQRKVPMYVAIGNHEYVTSSNNYYNLFAMPTGPNTTYPEKYYAMDYLNAHIISLYNTGNTMTIDANQYAWLTTELNNGQSKEHIFVTFHTPLYSSANQGSNTLLRNQLRPLFESKNVTAVLCAHDHDYERTYPLINNTRNDAATNAILYFVVGNGGGPNTLPTGDTWTAYKTNPVQQGFLRLGVNGKTITYTEINTVGTTLETFSRTYQ